MAEVPYQDFDSLATVSKSAEFGLGGRRWSCRTGDEVPFSLFQRLFTADPEDVTALFAQTGPFFEACLLPDQVADFMAMLERNDSPMTLAKMPLIMTYVTEHVLKRPTVPDGVSLAEPPPGGLNSEDGSSSPVTVLPLPVG